MLDGIQIKHLESLKIPIPNPRTRTYIDLQGGYLRSFLEFLCILHLHNQAKCIMIFKLTYVCN